MLNTTHSLESVSVWRLAAVALLENAQTAAMLLAFLAVLFPSFSFP
jgi:hypothetical protein